MACTRRTFLTSASSLIVGARLAASQAQDVTSSPATSQPCAPAGAVPRNRIKLYAPVPRRAPALEKVLNDHSARGYRLVAWRSVLLFETMPESAVGPEYVVLRRNNRPWQRDLNNLGSLGFRLLRGIEFYEPGIIMQKERPGSSSSGDPAPTPRYEYQTIYRRMEKIEPFERRINEAAAKGYTPIMVQRWYDYDGDFIDETNHFALLERAVADAPGPDEGAVPADRYKLLDLLDKEVENVLNTYGSRGYELVLVEDTTERLFLLEKSPDSRKREYFVVRPTVTSDIGAQLARDMNQAAARGFRLRPGAVFECSTKRKWGFLFGRGLAFIMELPAKPEPEPEYFGIYTWKESTYRKELDSALAQGFAPVGDGSMIILQRPRIPCAAPAR